MRKLITNGVTQRAECATFKTLGLQVSKALVAVMLMMILATGTQAQNPGPFYRQFNFNPYLFNPAYVGINKQIEASVAYRQQWANFKDAPVTAGASLQLPESDRVALGFNIMTDRQVLLQHSNFMATFGYVLPISRNQTIRFGLSGGVGLNKLDLEASEMNSNDPVIARSAGTNYYVDGNFGVVYTYDGLRLGFALTDFFKSDPFNPETFNQFKMSNLRNRLFSASYRFNVGRTEMFAIEPYALYRQTTDGKQDYVEVATVAYYQDKLWTGVSYNQNKGLALLFGMNVKDKFRFGYSYDFNTLGSNMASGGAHELHIGIRLASKKVSNKKTITQGGRVLANERPTTPKNDVSAVEKRSVLEEPSEDQEVHQQRLAEVDPMLKTTPADTEKSETAKTETTAPAVAKTAPEAEKTKPASTTTAKATKPATPRTRENFSMSSGHHYVVVGVFKGLSGAMQYVKEAKGRGYAANIALNPKNNFYYVFIHSSTNLDDARKKRNEYKLKNLFKEAWVFTME
ncbi:PorP/SprF family type IX secretion system membrane protein [Chryseolinea sp. T2]|uniref:PorP/SprF family type IX secretion system membrane protein n=1 Tax=Chryseolinea sp. T2 TaxID=3129255 RepID=UPI0030788B3A